MAADERKTIEPDQQQRKWKNERNISLVNETFINVLLLFSNCSNISIENCGFYRSAVDFRDSHDISIQNCDFVKARNRLDHSVQLNQCGNARIVANYFEEPIGESEMADIISVYKSNGSEKGGIEIRGNYIVGGGPNSRGGGIMLGDNMGDNQWAVGNTLVDPGQYGIAIAGGVGNVIEDNVVMSQEHSWSNVGIFVWGVPQRGSTVTDPVVRGNRVGWTNRQGKNNGFWKGANVEGLVNENNVFDTAYEAVPRPDGVGRQHKNSSDTTAECRNSESDNEKRRRGSSASEGCQIT